MKGLTFKKHIVENLVKDCLLNPVRDIYSKTCQQFISRMNAQCKLKEQLKIMRQIFFMEAGHHMHQYAAELFENLDRGKPVDNQYMLNGHFIDSVRPLFEGKKTIS